MVLRLEDIIHSICLRQSGSKRCLSLPILEPKPLVCGCFPNGPFHYPIYSALQCRTSSAALEPLLGDFAEVGKRL